MRQNFNDLRTVGDVNYKDRNFCTVAALACTLDWSFGKAHRHMAKHGRKNGRGMFEEDWAPAIAEAAIKAGKRFVPYRDTGKTLKRFCKDNPNGTFYVKVRGHALAIVDGVMHDWTADTAGRRKIISVYQLEG